MSAVFPSIALMIPDLKTGDQDAWNRLFERFRAGLTSKTRILLASSNRTLIQSPDDLVQETFLKAWKNRESFKGQTTSQFAKWLLTILRNTFIDSCRNPSPEIKLATWFEFLDQAKSPSSEIVSIEQEAILHACIAELAPKYQSILILRHFEGLKFSEMANKTGFNQNTVAGIYRRGIAQLTELMELQKRF